MDADNGDSAGEAERSTAASKRERAGLVARVSRRARKAGKGTSAGVSRETGGGDPCDVSRETVSLAPARAPALPRIVAVANQKGGVGKTTTAVNIAAALGMYGLKVLCIDLDPQGNASTALGIDADARTPGVYEVLIGAQSLSDILVPCPQVPGVMVAPASVDLAGAEVELVTEEGREFRLARAVEAVAGSFDYVIVDCPPALGLLTINGLVAAREVMIPIQCEYYALEGLGQLLSSIELVAEHLNPGLRIGSIVLTMYDSRLRLADQVVAEVRQHFKEAVLTTLVPRSVRVAEAPSYASTVVTYDQTSRGAQAYLLAARELSEQPVPGIDLTAAPEATDVSRETAEPAPTDLAESTGGRL